MNTQNSIPVSIIDDNVVSRIYHLRGKRIMLDSDLAQLYRVETKVLNQAVKRNTFRFPEDFMFKVTQQEWEHLKSQIVTSSAKAQSGVWGGRRTVPFAFPEQGIAILVNIQIIRVFSRMRELVSTHKETLFKLKQIEKALLKQHSQLHKHDEDIDSIFKVLKELLQPLQLQPVRKRIGFKVDA